MHNYAHVQLLSRLEAPRDRNRAGDEPRERGRTGSYIHWLPETQPALPLPASSSVGLLLCLLLSLYGPEYLEEIRRDLSGDPRRRQRLRREYDQILGYIERK